MTNLAAIAAASESTPAATIVVSTRNRREDLRRLLTSAVAQRGEPEIIVIDDGSTDATAQMVRAAFPSVRVERSETSRGYIVQRNLGAELASAPIIVSVDDDAQLPSPSTVAQAVADFDDPRIGAVALPFVDVRRSPNVRQRAPDDRATYVVPTYWGTAHALRRDLFVALGGYRASFVHQCEEMDYALRLLDAGFVTRLGRADPLLHFESPARRSERIAFFDRRNNVLHGWCNVPMPYLPVRLAKVVVETAILARHPGPPSAMGRGLVAGMGEIFRGRIERDPVGRAAYRLNHRLRRGGPVALEEIAHLLPAPGAPISR